ncbi:hypothetical protein L195_g028760 [Trifolium pratense]|uniref:Uncharacterized protein n=1 Tax=Trifolium pratense TaxID=57577 RepID=A0A2K3L2V3_TRIPR|nr:hypothetical protein L195_g028760 [Trifolium pratense]
MILSPTGLPSTISNKFGGKEDWVISGNKNLDGNLPPTSSWRKRLPSRRLPGGSVCLQPSRPNSTTSLEARIDFDFGLYLCKATLIFCFVIE